MYELQVPKLAGFDCYPSFAALKIHGVRFLQLWALSQPKFARNL